MHAASFGCHATGLRGAKGTARRRRRVTLGTGARPLSPGERGARPLRVCVYDFLPFVALWAAMLIAARHGQVWLSLAMAPCWRPCCSFASS